jgi:hypothetical protein
LLSAAKIASLPMLTIRHRFIGSGTMTSVYEWCTAMDTAWLPSALFIRVARSDGGSEAAPPKPPSRTPFQAFGNRFRCSTPHLAAVRLACAAVSLFGCNAVLGLDERTLSDAGGALGDADATTITVDDATTAGDSHAETTVEAEAKAATHADAATTPDANAETAGDADAMAKSDADGAVQSKVDAVAQSDAANSGDGSDGSVSCGADNKACTINGHAGLCKVNVCSQCAEPGDDTTCCIAYAGVYLCLAGTCWPGDCRTDSDCANNANGGICGISRPNFCGKCTSDQQCAGITGKPVCDATTGKCNQGLCLPDGGSVLASNPPLLCPVNASDVCCAAMCVPAAGPFPCCPEDPDAGNYCTQKIGSGATCQNNVCTKCNLVTNYTYAVDPNNGDDSIGTGDLTAGCAFKTITRALQVVPANPPLPVTITVLGGSTVQESNGEKFPINIPKGVTITTSGGTVTVNVPATQTGFALNASNSALMGAAASTLVVSGVNNTGSIGIVASAGSDATTQIANLDVTGFLDEGIRVQGTGVLAIGSWVSSTKNGTASGPRSGLHVTDTGHAIVSPAANTVTRFDENTRNGIEVDGSGFITVTGTVMDAAAGTGTVLARANDDAGLYISQSGNTPAQNVITGLVSYASPNGLAGIHLLAGSNVKLRNSVSLANVHAGVRVDMGPAGSNDISKIDLGSANDGGNTVQAALGMSPNGGAGLCLSLKTNSSATLSAQGNVFETSNCARAPTSLTINKVDCTGFVDLGLENIGTADAGVANAIDVTKCTHP